jgi:hypothetical protein
MKDNPFASLAARGARGKDGDGNGGGGWLLTRKDEIDVCRRHPITNGGFLLEFGGEDLQGHHPEEGVHTGEVRECESAGLCQVRIARERGTSISPREAIHIHTQAGGIDTIRRDRERGIPVVRRRTGINEEFRSERYVAFDPRQRLVHEGIYFLRNRQDELRRPLQLSKREEDTHR